MKRALASDDRLLWGQIVENSPDAVLVYRLVRDRRGRAASFRRQLVNEAGTELLDSDPLGLTGLLPDAAPQDLFQRYAAVAVGGVPLQLDKVVPDEAGGVRHSFDVEARWVDDDIVMVRISDVTRRARTSIVHRREAERLRGLARRSADVLASLHPDGRLAWASEAAAGVLGVSAEQVVGRSLEDLVAPDHREQLRDDRGQLRLGTVRVQARARSASEEPRWLEIRVHQEELGQVAVIRDITAQRRLEATVAELNGPEGLPGVVSRKALLQQLVKEIARRQRYGRTVSIVALALDGRTRLRQSGRLDEAHRELAEAATGVLRTADVIGAWSEDVFLLVLPETPVQGAVRACERLVERLAQVRLPGAASTTLSISAGVTDVDFGDDGKAVLRRALEAMAHNRRQGPGTVGLAGDKRAA